MRTEFRRDVSHNYLILQEKEKVDTSAYQVRMLLGNLIPSVLKCHLESLDGQEYFCYDITSRQSVSMLFEEKKFQAEDLRRIFEGLIHVMEDLTEFLINPDQLVLQPEYIYIDVSAGKTYFCCLPGFHREIQEQFRELAEYMLPKLDHQDHQAVALGYGIYRKTLEPGFQLEILKEAVYHNEQNKAEHLLTDKEEMDGLPFKDKQDEIVNWDNFKSQDDRFKQKEEIEAPDLPEKQRKIWAGKALFCGLGVLAVLGIMAAAFLSFIPWIPVEAVLAVGIGILAGGAFISWIIEVTKRKKEEAASWRTVIKKKQDSKEEYKNPMEMEWEEEDEAEAKEQKKEKKSETTGNLGAALEKEKEEELYGETVLLFEGRKSGPSAFVSREPGELATIFLEKDLTVIGKLANASDAVIPVPTVSRVHARVRKRDGEYYLADLNSRNGTSVNGTILKGGEEYLLQDEDQVDFAQARYIFVK